MALLSAFQLSHERAQRPQLRTLCRRQFAGEAVSFPYRLRNVNFTDVSGKASQN